ncbi:unnamed protein product, partial [marine sediment metagenome]
VSIENIAYISFQAPKCQFRTIRIYQGPPNQKLAVFVEKVIAGPDRDSIEESLERT